MPFHVPATVAYGPSLGRATSAAGCAGAACATAELSLWPVGIAPSTAATATTATASTRLGQRRAGAFGSAAGSGVAVARRAEMTSARQYLQRPAMGWIDSPHTGHGTKRTSILMGCQAGGARANRSASGIICRGPHVAPL